MKQELSSLDLYYLIKEFQILISAKIDKVFQKDKVFLFQLHAPGKGKKILRVSLPSLIYITEHKEDFTDDTGKFGLSIRKHVKNNRIREIEQIDFERIIKIKLESKDKVLFLYFELFKPGNIVLTDEENKIIMASTYKGFGSRLIRPGKQYEFPKKEYNFLDINENNLSKLINSSDKSSIVITLATSLGLGGVYAEELLVHSKIDKKKTKLDDKELKRLLKSIEHFKSRTIELNTKLEEYFTPEIKKQKETIQESKYDKKKNEIEGIIRQQVAKIKGLEISIDDNQKKGELIYEKYIEIENIISQINEAKKTLTDDVISKKLKSKKIKYDQKTKTITFDLN
jgi:predicted ribosome quality control (RQC) complex YloA/Tae2 family protein